MSNISPIRKKNFYSKILLFLATAILKYNSHKINPFKIYNSVVLNIVRAVQPSLIPEYPYPLERMKAHQQLVPFLPLPAPGIPLICSVLLDLSVSGISYNGIVRWVASGFCHTAFCFQVHTCCTMWKYFILLVNNIPLYGIYIHSSVDGHFSY